MTRPLVVGVVLLFGGACGGTSALPPERSSDALLMLADVYFTPCMTSFGPIARGKRFSAMVGRIDATASLEAVDVSFSLRDAAGNLVALELPRAGTFTTRFEHAGRYELTATLADGTALRQDLEVVEQAGLRLSPLFRRVTTHAATGACAETHNTVQFAGHGPVALALNQVLETSVVPIDADGLPLLGKLEAELSGDLEISKSTTWLGYRFEPTRPGRALVRVTDTELLQRAELEFDVTPAAPACDAR
ncbi:MAG: hypothetical protein JNJ54_22395 [Myxococcaceae bacterium]|nr:hypothetical protein [Myxococcaceae bacterium]